MQTLPEPEQEKAKGGSGSVQYGALLCIPRPSVTHPLLEVRALLTPVDSTNTK